MVRSCSAAPRAAANLVHYLLLQRVTNPRSTILNAVPRAAVNLVHYLLLQKVTSPRFTILNATEPRAAPPFACALFSRRADATFRRGHSVIDPLQSLLYGESPWLQESPVTNNSAPSYIHTAARRASFSAVVCVKESTLLYGLSYESSYDLIHLNKNREDLRQRKFLAPARASAGRSRSGCSRPFSV